MRREINRALPILLGVCALSGGVLAQDSTSLPNTLPGDSLDPTSTTEQINDYVVDVGALKSSSGYVWGVAPLAKAPMDFGPTPHYFNGQLSSHAISNHTRVAVPFARNSYSMWHAAGAGVNGDPAINAPGTSVNTSSAVGNQFGYGFSAFSSDDPLTPTISFGSIIGGTVNYDLVTPSRLHVTRVMAGTNDKTWQCNVSQFGFGGVDADGVVSFRVDGYQSTGCGGYMAVTGNNWFAVDTLARTGSMVNVIHDLGADDAAATVRVVNNSATTHGVPTMIPGDTAGGAPILMGANWNGDYVYGDGSGTPTSTQSHQPGGGTRGQISYSQKNFPGIFGGSTHGTGAVLAKGSGTNTLALWGLSSTAAPLSAKFLAVPLVVTDPETGWDSDALDTTGTEDPTFGNYFSSTFFRGGAGQVSVGSDQSGRLLAAAQMHHAGWISNTNADNLIAVARTTNGTTAEWVVAAYTAANDGKPVYGSFGTVPIGKLVSHEAGGGGTASGPSLSCPTIDSVGNLYFLGRVELTGDAFYRDTLVRALYDEATFSYRLEIVLREGDVVFGNNSQANYEVQFLSIAGSSGVTPSTMFSHAMDQSAYLGQNPANLSPASTETLGGLVVAAGIIYDVNDDGLYLDQANNPGSPDEDYNVLLYVTSARDCNNNGIADDIDIAEGTSSDLDLDGLPDECGAGTPFCFGDGTGVPCPCGNFGGTNEGCANSAGSGAVLFTTGSSSVAADDLGLSVSQIPPNKPGLAFAGKNQLNGLLFGDGIRCAGGQLKRFGVRSTNGNGEATWGPNLGTSGFWIAGDTRYFQIWYRDPNGSPCGNNFNISSAVAVTFTP